MKKFLIIIFIVLLLLIGLATTLVLLLVKSKRQTERAAVLRWNTTGVTIAGTPGIPGNGSNQLNAPWGLAVTYDYSLYIADRSNHRIQKYSNDSSVGITVAGSANCIQGNTSSFLSVPSAVLLDSDENMYIADVGNQRIQYWPRGTNSGITVAGGNGLGSGTNHLNTPYGLTKDWNSDVLYISDFVYARVISYNMRNLSSTVVFGGHGNGLNSSQLNRPVAIYFDSFSSSFFTINRDSSNVVRWKLGDTNWSLAAGSMLGIGGNTSSLLLSPHGLTVDPMGNLYVADSSNCRVQFFANGQLVGVTIAGVTRFCGSGNSVLRTPFGLTLDNQLNLYVADTTNHRIQKFSRY